MEPPRMETVSLVLCSQQHRTVLMEVLLVFRSQQRP